MMVTDSWRTIYNDARAFTPSFSLDLKFLSTIETFYSSNSLLFPSRMFDPQSLLPLILLLFLLLEEFP